jgi:hypothetical protein
MFGVAFACKALAESGQLELLSSQEVQENMKRKI